MPWVNTPQSSGPTYITDSQMGRMGGSAYRGVDDEEDEELQRLHNAAMEEQLRGAQQKRVMDWEADRAATMRPYEHMTPDQRGVSLYGPQYGLNQPDKSSMYGLQSILEQEGNKQRALLGSDFMSPADAMKLPAYTESANRYKSAADAIMGGKLPQSQYNAPIGPKPPIMYSEGAGTPLSAYAGAPVQAATSIGVSPAVTSAGLPPVPQAAAQPDPNTPTIEAFSARYKARKPDATPEEIMAEYRRRGGR